MSREIILGKLMENILIPVIRVPKEEEALLIAELLIRKGITVIEITMTVPGAGNIIKNLKTAYGSKIIVGAGTVIDKKTAKNVINQGAEFIVSPVVNKKVIQFCRKKNIPVIPGALTPTEIINARTWGADLVKIFPASVLGGIEYIKALKNVFPQVGFVPTGGIDHTNLSAYLDLGIRIIGAGSNLIDPRLVRENRIPEIEKNIDLYLDIIEKYKGRK